MMVEGSLLTAQYNTNAQFVISLANLFNTISLSFSTSGFAEQLNLEEQTQSSTLAARVPKAPLFTHCG